MHLSAVGLLLVDHSEALFAMARDLFTKDKVLVLDRMSGRLFIAQYLGSRFFLAFSFTYPHLNRLVREIVNHQFVRVHLQLLRARTVGAAAARSSNHLSKWAPTKATVQGADFLN